MFLVVYLFRNYRTYRMYLDFTYWSTWTVSGQKFLRRNGKVKFIKNT